MEKTTHILRSFKPEGLDQEVKFYKLNEDGTCEHGTTLEEMMRVSIERLQELNGRFSSRENALAITKMQEALMWLNERTREKGTRSRRQTFKLIINNLDRFFKKAYNIFN